MNVTPTTSFEAVIDTGETGLVTDIGVLTVDNAGATTQAFSVAGIIETPAGSGVYAATRTSPGTSGQYTLVWQKLSTGETLGIEDLLVTTEETTATIGSGHLYVTRDDLKEIIGIKSTDYSDKMIDVAVEAASRSIEGYKGGQRFYPAVEIRYYSAMPGDRYVDIDDLISASSVTVDTNGDGTYDRTWVEGTEFLLDPPNAPLAGQPKRRLVIRSAGGFTYPSTSGWVYETWSVAFPGYQRAIKIDGTFGWAATPGPVKQAAVLIANRFLARVRSAPLGMAVAATAEAVAMARLGRLDPDVAFLLDTIPGGNQRAFV